MDAEVNLVQSISDPVSAVLTAFDGRELSIISLATQTEWSWIDDMKMRQTFEQQSVKSEPGNSETEDKKAVTESKAPTDEAVLHAKRQLSESADLVAEQQSAAMDAESAEGRSAAGQRKKGGGARSSRSSMRSGRSGGSSSQSGGRAIFRGKGSLIPAYPEPRIDDEFGVLLVEDDDSDLSDTNVKSDFLGGSAIPQSSATPGAGVAASEAAVDDEELAAGDGVLPSVGPPQILQYLRESQIPVEEAFPGLTIDLSAVSMREGDSCDFCGRAILGLPSREDQASKDPEQLYCCAEFRKLLEFALQYQAKLLKQRQLADPGLIDVGPHAHFGARGKKSAQERERLREEAERRRKLLQQERQRRAAEAAQATAQGMTEMSSARMRLNLDALSAAVISNTEPSVHVETDVVVGRQMRTINYSLSSMRCLEVGWTLRPPSPLMGDGASEWQIYDFDLDEVTDLGITPRGAASSHIEKFYPNGKKFLTIFADRTGNVFYPSGRLAVIILRPADRPQNLVYIVFDDKSQQSRNCLLGVFDNIGKGTCYFRDGKIRINYDPSSGIDLDQQGSRRRHWYWTAQPLAAHVHAPPFQPISLALNKTVGLRLASRDSVYLSFVTSSRSCKINVGARFKMHQVVDSVAVPPSTHLSPLDLHLSEVSTRIGCLLEKISLLSSHPHHPRPDKVPTSLHLETRRQKNLANRAKLGLETTRAS